MSAIRRLSVSGGLGHVFRWEDVDTPERAFARTGTEE